MHKLILSLLFFASLHCAANEQKKPMKVLFFTTQFPSIAQTPMFNQVASLIDYGVDLHIFSEKKLDQNVVHDVIEKYNLNSRVTYFSPPENINDYDIIHIQYGGLLHDYLKVLAKFPGKVVCSFRGADVTCILPKYPQEIPIINKRVDMFLPVCYFFKLKLIQTGINESKINVLRSAINLNEFHYRESKAPKNGKIKILSVCRLVQKKGLDDALKAIALVKKVCPNIEYTIIGEGEDEDKLVQLVKNLGIQDVVVFAGIKNHEDVAKALNGSHLFLLPSKETKGHNTEGIPNAIKEAMAVGLPIVSTVHAGIPELVKNGASGFLVPEGKPRLIAKKIVNLIRHPQLWSKMGKTGRDVIEQEYDMNIVHEQLYNYYLTLINEGKK